MSYKIELQSNNTDLQSILNTINAMDGGSSYKSKLSDNNVDLQKVLEMALNLPHV